MKKILDNIVKFRKEKGFTYENMADELGLSAAAYRKIETNQTHLTVERLYQISETLHTSVAKLLDIDREEYSQTVRDQATGYLQKIEHFYQENEKTHEKLFASQQETIATQNETIGTLKILVASLQAQLAVFKNEG
jgi:transcriptional regulator with XRE-family HTH domain